MKILPIIVCAEKRRNTSLKITLESFKQTDWPEEPICMFDGNIYEDPRKNADSNCLCTLKKFAETDYDYLLYLEDDIIINKHIYHNLTNWYPIKNGLLTFGSLFNNFNLNPENYDNNYEIVKVGDYWGTQGCILSKTAVRYILNNMDIWNSDFNVKDFDKVYGCQDVRISRTLQNLSKTIYYYVPGLVKEQDCPSTIGNDWRGSIKTYFDEDFKAMSKHVLNYINNTPNRNWFDYEDYYIEIANNVKDGDVLVEIGNHYGASSLYLADLIKKKNVNAKLYLVDISTGENRQALKFASNDYDIHNVIFIDEDSQTAHNHFQDKSIDFLFIDGSHSYDDVRKDIALWGSKVKNNGIMSGHDFNYIKDVRFAVEQQIPEHLMSIRKTRMGFNIWTRDNNIFKLGKFAREFSNIPTDYMIYIPYVNRIDLLKLAIDSQSKHLDKILVINQSGKDISKEISNVAIFDMEHMHFSRMQNFAQNLAYYYNLKYIFFQHNDCWLTSDIINNMIEICEKDNKIAVVFTYYDCFALFNVSLLRNIGCWDESFNWYEGDIDFYQRILRDGYKHAEAGINAVCHIGSETLNSLSPEQFKSVKFNQDWAVKHYIHKWGGYKGQESNHMPYNGNP